MWFIVETLRQTGRAKRPYLADAKMEAAVSNHLAGGKIPPSRFSSHLHAIVGAIAIILIGPDPKPESADWHPLQRSHLLLKLWSEQS
ncbi:hypothetical protein PMI41_04590 [Phyllobacterium sp. YR531]|nr:hypothetical protein PMI41_04590 [Phyllobacterium sp. YR531]